VGGGHGHLDRLELGEGFAEALLLRYLETWLKVTLDLHRLLSWYKFRVGLRSSNLVVIVVKLLASSRVGVIESGHWRVCAGGLVHGLVIIASRGGIAGLDALVAGKLRGNSVDHL